MPDDGQDNHAAAKWAPPREPKKLRRWLRAAGDRRLPRVPAPDDGCVAARVDEQDLAAGPGSPNACDYGISFGRLDDGPSEERNGREADDGYRTSVGPGCLREQNNEQYVESQTVSKAIEEPPKRSDDAALPPFGRKGEVIQAMETARRQRSEQRRKKAVSRGGEREGQDGGSLPGMSNLSENAETQARYLTRGKQLLARYKWEIGGNFANEDIDPRDFASWMMSLQLHLSPNSWGFYRLAAAAVIQTIPHSGIEQAIATLMPASRTEKDARRVYKQTREKSGNISSSRAKLMKATHFRELRCGLRISRSKEAEWLDDWLVAGVHTGLLPGEWPFAALEISRDRVLLHVVNANAIQGQVNGINRTLDISAYTDETREAINRMVKRSEQWALQNLTGRRQSDVAQLLYKMCNALFPRMSLKYSLFSLRHQFIANMKEVVVDEAKRATLIGDIGVQTEVEHYGKRRIAWDIDDIKEIPTPIDHQVALVRKFLATHKERADLRMMVRAAKRRK